MDDCTCDDIISFGRVVCTEYFRWGIADRVRRVFVSLVILSVLDGDPRFYRIKQSLGIVKRGKNFVMTPNKILYRVKGL